MTKAKPQAAEKPAKAETKAATATATEAPAAETRGNDIPKTSLTSAITTDLPNDAPAETATEPSQPQSKAVEQGIGLIKCHGSDFRYVGIAPARDKDAKTPAGNLINVENSTFIPLDNVAFSDSIQVKDPKSGEFYYPVNCSSWEGCEHNGSKLLS